MLRNLAIMVFGGLASFAAHAAEGECPNCEAYVEMSDVHADDLIGRAALISSMPLVGKVVHWRPGAGVSTVRIGTLPDYARQHGIDSFDVAKKVLGLVQDVAAEWRVESVRAAVKPLEAAKNVGSIGHSR